MKLKKLLVSLLLATGLTLGGWAWLSSLSGSPAMAAPAARPKLAPSPVTVTLTSSQDNTLIESPTGNFSNGAGDSFFVGRTAQGSDSIRRGVIAFDLSAIPAGSTIISASLKLNMSMTQPGSQPITLHRLLADWGEGSSVGSGGGAPATPGDATWLHSFYTTTVWTTPGGDFTAAPSALTQVGGNGFYEWGSSQMVTDVQGWYNTPATNFGWLLQGNESAGSTAKRFGSRENSTPANRPALSVTYLPPPPSLTLTKQVSKANPGAGQTITYTVIVSNSGQGPATKARVSDILPAGINFIGPVILNPPGAGIPGIPPTLASNLTVTAGTRVTLTFRAQLNSNLATGTVLTNTAAVTSSEVETPTTGSVVLTVAPPPPPNLALTKGVDDATPILGQRVTYTIIITNSGQGPAIGGRISDTLPAGISFIGPVTLTPSGAGIAGNGGTLPNLAYNLTITPGTRITVSFPVSVSPGLTPGTILTNTAAITSNEVTTPILSRVSLEIAWPLYLPIVMK